MKIKALFFIYLILHVINSSAQKKTAAEKELYDDDLKSLKRALKHPEKAKEVSVWMYSDSIFPNAEILKLTNVEHLVVRARNILRKNKTDSLLTPLVIRVDTEKLKELSHLKYLDFTFFDFRKFPIELCYIRALEGLNMSICLIDSLPREIENLKNLKVLIMRINNLKELPVSIVKLDSLRTLDLGNNSFRQIPDIICEIPNLRNVNLGNPESRTEQVIWNWQWPFPIHTNDINYNSEEKILKKLLERKQFEKIGMQYETKEIRKSLKLSLGSNDLYSKTTWSNIIIH